MITFVGILKDALGVFGREFRGAKGGSVASGSESGGWFGTKCHKAKEMTECRGRQNVALCAGGNERAEFVVLCFPLTHVVLAHYSLANVAVTGCVCCV